MEKEIIKKLMSELGKRSAAARRKKYGNFGTMMLKYKAKKREKLSTVSASNGLT